MMAYIGYKFNINEMPEDEYANIAEWCKQNDAYVWSEDNNPIVEVRSQKEIRDRLAPLTEVSVLKRHLSETDYITAKIVEASLIGQEAVDELKVKYADIIEQRRQWRIRINELENGNN